MNSNVTAFTCSVVGCGTRERARDARERWMDGWAVCSTRGCYASQYVSTTQSASHRWMDDD